MPDGASDAEDLFAEYVARYQAGEVVDLQEYIERRPEFADRLRELETQWRRVARIVRRAARGQSLADQMAARFGAGPDPRADTKRESDSTGELGLRAVIASIRGRVGANERYRFRGEIGEGGMGIVMRVWDVELKRNVAMKVIRDPAERVGWPGFEGVTSRVVRRFIEEAQITAQLDHPGIVPVHEMGVDDEGRLFFTMRLVRGQGLDKIFELARDELEGWNRTRLLGVLLKACEALAYAHDKGVVHRDLKPSNIMVGRFGEVYVMDWGLARPLHAPDLADIDAELEHGPGSTYIHSDVRGTEGSPSPEVTRDGDIVGTFAYMPPEQARGALSRVGKHADVYAMGAVLYRLLCGRNPYQEPSRRLTAQQTLARLLAGPPQPIEELATDAPPELLAICRKAMLRDPDKRYAAMLDFADDLRAFLEHRVVRAYRTDGLTTLAKWVDRNRMFARTMAVAAAVIIAGTAYFLVRLGREVEDKQRAFDTLETRTREHDRQNHRLRARELIARADTLYPATPASVPPMRLWLADGEALVEAAKVHEADRPLLTAGTAAQARVMRELFQAIDDVRTTCGAVEQLIERATSLEQRSLAEHADEWTRAIARIEESPRYRDESGTELSLAPQLGLVPLGPSPNSDLEEFWVVDSGTAPQARDDTDREWLIGPTTGIVLVLLPGEREFTMGSSDRKHGSGGQTCSVVLHPFFIGKHEVTQGQWLRVMGDRPAYMAIDRPRSISGNPRDPLFEFDDRCPVESIHWFDAQRFAQRLDVRLPFEAQWEFACRAATRTAYWTGELPKSIVHLENVNDVLDSLHASALDEFPFTAPVGSLAQNGFGLFDVHGNVAEWCRDAYQFEFGPARLTRGDGARDDFAREDAGADPLAVRILRGGSYANTPLECMSADRLLLRARDSNSATGLRVARPLWPCPWCEAGAAPHQ